MGYSLPSIQNRRKFYFWQKHQIKMLWKLIITKNIPDMHLDIINNDFIQ